MQTHVSTRLFPLPPLFKSLALFTALMIADLVTTMIALHAGVATEANPLGAHAYAVWSGWILVAMKTIAVGAVYISAQWMQNIRWYRIWLHTVNAVMGAIVLNNVSRIAYASHLFDYYLYAHW